MGNASNKENLDIISWISSRRNVKELKKQIINKSIDIHHLSKNKNKSALMILCESNNIYFDDEEKTEKNYDIIKLLIDNGANINLQDINGYSVLMYACGFCLNDKYNKYSNFREICENQIAIVKLLINNGINVLLQDDDILHKTALRKIIKCNCYFHIAIQELLLDNGANINEQNRFGDTLLIEAILGGNFKTAQILIENGASLDIQQKDGNTALIYSVSIAQISTVKLLIARGANINLKNYDDCSALYHAQKNKHKCELGVYSYNYYQDVVDIEKLLIDNGAQLEENKNIKNKNLKENTDTKTDIETDKCSVCFDNKKCILFNECRHICCCISCSKNLKDCPICRTKIKTYGHVFYT